MGWVRLGDDVIGSDDLNLRVRRAAAGFVELGIAPGDTIAVYLRNDIPFVEASLAAGMIGAYSVPVNWHYVGDEARYLLEDCGAKVIVIHADLWQRVGDNLPKQAKVLIVPTPEAIRAAYGVPLEHCAVPANATAWDQWLESFEPYSGAAQPSPGSMIYTSGTTGRPKGVRRFPPNETQAVALAEMIRVGYGFERPADVVTIVPGPLYHSAPNAYGLISASSGAGVILQTKFDAEELLQMIEKYRVTHLQMVPIMFIRLLKLPIAVREKYDLSSLEFVVHAAAPCPPQIKREMIAWWGPIINEYYGASETGMVTFVTSEEWLAHPGTVGREVGGSKVRIVDSDGNEVPRGTVGEIVAVNPNLAEFAYHGGESQRKVADPDGYILPGDVGYLDNDGYLFLCDRVKDMIISGGVNIYPAEIESELHKAPGVVDCAVFGIPDEEFGESVCAAVQLAAGTAEDEAQLRDYLASRISGFKIPRKFLFMSELPREDSGKVFKRKIREPFWQNHERKI